MIKVYLIKDWKNIINFGGHIFEISSLEFSLDSKLLISSSKDWKVKIWNI